MLESWVSSLCEGIASRWDVAVGVLLSLLLMLLAARVFTYGAGLEETRPPDVQSERPIIGILSMELSPKVQSLYGHHDSYIAASYVKFVEGAGARVAPILIGQTPEYYQSMAQSVNGLLFPGGATYFHEKDGYADAGKELYRQALKINEEGSHFPVMGICLGMELLAVAAAGVDLRSECDSHDALPLQFLPGSRESRLFGSAPTAVLRTLERENVTINQHKLCVTQDSLESEGLSRDWLSLTSSRDRDGKKFVSSLEHRHLPLYGLQFHPEKNIYEWKSNKKYPHSEIAVQAARFFADFLVREARRNSHHFQDVEEEVQRLIYRHPPTYTGDRLQWEQLYFLAHPTSTPIHGLAEVNISTVQDSNSEFE